MKRLFLTVLIISMLVLTGVQLGAMQAGNFWQASFFNNATLTGTPVLNFSTAFVNFNWGTGSPHPSVPVDFFSARFTTSAFFNAGINRFTVTADDDIRLFVNGRLILNTFGTNQPGKTFSVDFGMPQGMSTIQVDYAEYTGLAYVSVTWNFIKNPITPGPTPVQPPPSATSVVTTYGDFTSCIRQNIHQANCFQSNGQWNSPDLGSIRLEPQIVIWGNCTPGQRQNQVIRTGDIARPTQCSKTEAGWFPV